MGRDTWSYAKIVCFEIPTPILTLVVIYLAIQLDYSAIPHTTSKLNVPSVDMIPAVLNNESEHTK